MESKYVERLLSIDSNLPIIVPSAYTSLSHDFITWFARAYVVKSEDLRELRAPIENALNGMQVVENTVPSEQASS